MLQDSLRHTRGSMNTHSKGADTHAQPEVSTAGSCSTFGRELKGLLDARRLWQGAKSASSSTFKGGFVKRLVGGK